MKRWTTLLIAACAIALSPVHSQVKQPISNYQVLFSPDDRVADELISLIGKEETSVKAAVYCLMHHGIAKALIDAHQRGVHVEVIVDPFSVKSRSPVKKMGAARLPVFVWHPSVPESSPESKKKRKAPLMHDKFCILGDNIVWTGSFNFTFEAATANRENVIVLENTQVAASYLKEFDRLKKSGCIPLNEYLAKKAQHRL